MFIAFAVILVTLLGQGLTLPLLIRRLGIGDVGIRTVDEEISARARMARVALAQLAAFAEETQSPPEAVHRVNLFYADRVEALDQQRHLGAASELEQADEARVRRATYHLLERLMDVERAELQRMRNCSAIDSLVARRLQRDLDLLRLRDRM